MVVDLRGSANGQPPPQRVDTEDLLKVFEGCASIEMAGRFLTLTADPFEVGDVFGDEEGVQREHVDERGGLQAEPGGGEAHQDDEEDVDVLTVFNLEGKARPADDRPGGKVQERDGGVDEKQVEVLLVSVADARADVEAVMIKLQRAAIASRAVVSSLGLPAGADATVRVLFLRLRTLVGRVADGFRQERRLFPANGLGPPICWNIARIDERCLRETRPEEHAEHGDAAEEDPELDWMGERVHPVRDHGDHRACVK